MSTQSGREAFAATAPVLATLITAARGPMALATSLEPCANAIEQAVTTINTPNTRSTVWKWSFLSAFRSGWIRRIATPPIIAMTTAMASASR